MWGVRAAAAAALSVARRALPARIKRWGRRAWWMALDPDDGEIRAADEQKDPADSPASPASSAAGDASSPPSKPADGMAKPELKLFLPNDEGLKRFYVIVFIFSTYNMVIIPFRAAFLYDEAPHGVYLVLDYAGDVVLWVHLYLGFRTCYHDSDGMWVEDPAKIRAQYVRSAAFIANLISLMPADLFALAFGWKHYVLLRLFRFARLPWTLRLLEMWEYGASFSNYVRLLKSLIIVVLIIHSISCLYRAVALAAHDPEALGAAPDGPPPDLAMQYILSVIWTMGTLAENTGNPPRNLSEAVLTAFVMFLGFSMVAAFIGGTSDLISNMNAAEVSFKEKMDIVSQFMSYRQLPPELQRRIVGYLEYMWRRQRGMDDKEILAELPPHLQAEIARHLNREILAKVPLFANADRSFLSELVTKLKPRLYGPGEYIIRYGEVGREMFFLSRGFVEVCSEDGTRVFKTMSDGEYFGEIALLLADKRTASVRARTYCDLFCLEKADLEELLEDYPDVHAMLREMARMRASNPTTASAAAGKGPQRTVSFSAAAHGILLTTRRASTGGFVPAGPGAPPLAPVISDADSSGHASSSAGPPTLPRQGSWREGRRGSNCSADGSDDSAATSPRGGPPSRGALGRRPGSFMADRGRMDVVLRHQWALRIIRRFVQAWAAIHRARREAEREAAAGRAPLPKTHSMRDLLGPPRRARLRPPPPGPAHAPGPLAGCGGRARGPRGAAPVPPFAGAASGPRSPTPPSAPREGRGSAARSRPRSPGPAPAPQPRPAAGAARVPPLRHLAVDVAPAGPGPGPGPGALLELPAAFLLQLTPPTPRKDRAPSRSPRGPDAV
eukprot:tig00021244_g19588.t1